MSHRSSDPMPPGAGVYQSRRERREAEAARQAAEAAAGNGQADERRPEAPAQAGPPAADASLPADHSLPAAQQPPAPRHEPAAAPEPAPAAERAPEPAPELVDARGVPVHSGAHPAYHDDHGVPVFEDEHGQHYYADVDGEGHPVQYVDEHGEPVHYEDHDGQPVAYEDAYAPVEAYHHGSVETAPRPARKKPSKKVRRRRRTLALLLVLAFFTAVVFFVAQMISPLLANKSDADFPGPGHDSVSFQIAPGAATRAVAADLVQQDVIASENPFLRALGNDQLHPGTFKLKKEMKAADAAAILSGKGGPKTGYAAVNAGSRISEVFSSLSDSLGIPVSDFEEAAKNPQSFGLPAKAPSLEGYLAPGEYTFPVDAKPKDILALMVKRTMDQLKADGITDPGKQYDILTLASIIQAEAGPADYGKVSGAIQNRLVPNNPETRGLIQSDATVSYGLGRKGYELTDSEKNDKSNKYNTYANPGLPVGPIGAPGQKAIDAAAKPTKTSAYYWVTVNLDTGETKFAKTLAEHNQNVALYQKWCSDHPGRCQ